MQEVFLLYFLQIEVKVIVMIVRQDGLKLQETHLYITKMNKIETFKILQHELGHIYEHCELKRNILTEEFANNFKIQ